MINDNELRFPPGITHGTPESYAFNGCRCKECLDYARGEGWI